MADEGSSDNLALRETLIECLTHTLSPQQHVRSSAEDRLKLLEVTEGKITIMETQYNVKNCHVQNFIFPYLPKAG
jgi:hypothetical protein